MSDMTEQHWRLQHDNSLWHSEYNKIIADQWWRLRKETRWKFIAIHSDCVEDSAKSLENED